MLDMYIYVLVTSVRSIPSPRAQSVLATGLFYGIYHLSYSPMSI